ncbi:MAG: GldG family protein [Chloroflexota bacterium]
MKSEWRRFAPLGLLVAGSAAVTAFVLYVVYRNLTGLPFLISAGVALIGLAVFALLDPERVRVIITGRQARYGSTVFVQAVAFIGIVVVVNILVFKLANLYPEKTKVDLTETKSNTLAPETIDTLAGLPEPVKALGFYSQQSAGGRENADALLRRYVENSKGLFTYEFLDPDTNLQAVKDAGIPQGKDGVISLQMGTRREIVDYASEQALTSALVKLMAGEQRVVYFLTGHGEHNPEDSGDVAYSDAKSALENKNYIVKVLNLRTDTAIPEDAAAIVVGGPVKPLADQEVQMLSDYVARGGALLVLQDPLIQTEFGDAADPLGAYLSQTWGITYGNDFVVQVATNQASPYVTGVELASHAIVSTALVNNPPFFVAAQSIQASEAFSNVVTTELVKSTPFYDNCYPSCSWSSTDPENISAWLSGGAGGPSNPTPEDLLGPVTVGVSAQMNGSEARLVVFGDSDFAVNAFFNSYGNSDLFVNSVDWAVGQEDLISLTPKDTVTRTLNVQPQNLAVVNNGLFLGLVVGLPGLVLLAGVANWLIRRRRG